MHIVQLFRFLYATSTERQQDNLQVTSIDPKLFEEEPGTQFLFLSFLCLSLLLMLADDHALL